MSILRHVHVPDPSRRGSIFFAEVFVSVLVLLCAAQLTHAEVSQCPGELCPVGSTLCEIDTNVAVANNAVLECGDRNVVIKNGLGKLTVAGAMTLRARNLTIENTRSIEASSASPSAAKITLELLESVSITGQVSAVNTGAGSVIRIVAGQDIVLEPKDGVGIDVRGMGQSVNGGELMLQAGRDIRVSSRILANGNDGTSAANQTSGGDVQLIAGAGIYINHPIIAFGRWFNGGHLSIQAGSDVEINHDHDGTGTGRNGEIDLDGHGADGDGGELDIRAGGRVLQSGPVSLSGGVGSDGGNASGGSARIEAGCGGVRLEDTLTAWGGLTGGGNLVVESRGDVSVASTITLNANKLGGDGGEISLTSQMGDVVIDGATRIYANGNVTSNTTEGVGGAVSLYGCQVDVAAGAVVESAGQSKGLFEATSLNSGTALQNSFGIRISENADVSAYSTSGKIILTVATVASGKCSNNPSTPCTLDTDCNISCTTGDCNGANPQLDGQVVQFSSIPTTQQNASLGPCATQCQ
jgi:hypothetical protein